MGKIRSLLYSTALVGAIGLVGYVSLSGKGLLDNIDKMMGWGEYKKSNTKKVEEKEAGRKVKVGDLETTVHDKSFSYRYWSGGVEVKGKNDKGETIRTHYIDTDDDGDVDYVKITQGSKSTVYRDNDKKESDLETKAFTLGNAIYEEAMKKDEAKEDKTIGDELSRQEKALYGPARRFKEKFTKPFEGLQGLFKEFYKEMEKANIPKKGEAPKGTSKEKPTQGKGWSSEWFKGSDKKTWDKNNLLEKATNIGEAILSTTPFHNIKIVYNAQTAAKPKTERQKSIDKAKKSIEQTKKGIEKEINNVNNLKLTPEAEKRVKDHLEKRRKEREAKAHEKKGLKLNAPQNKKK